MWSSASSGALITPATQSASPRSRNLAIHDADAGDAVLLIVGILRPHGCAGASRENGRQNQPSSEAACEPWRVLSNVR